MSTRTLVIADLHGNADALTDILRRTGVMDREGGRVPGTHVVQLGDLANMAPAGIPFRGFVSEDERILKMALDGWIDELLVGNHELSFTHGLDSGNWHGMALGPWQLEPETLRCIRTLVGCGQFKAAAVVGDTLVTHAGVAKFFEDRVSRDVHETANRLNKWLIDAALAKSYNPAHNIINGQDGIFWIRPYVDYGSNPYDSEADWQIKDCHLSDFWPQMVGHTPVRNNPTKIRDHWFIDTGGYMENKGQVNYEEGVLGATASAMIYEDGEWRVA